MRAHPLPSLRRGAVSPYAPVAFLILAAVLWIDPWGGVKPPAKPQALDADWYDPTLPRHPYTAPTIDIDGAEMVCSDCHADDTPPPEPKMPLQSEHTRIRLDHGANDRCFNCHHPIQRDFLAGYSGETIPFDHAEGRCGRCHGDTHRDWKRNIHGRRTGYWDTLKGEAVTAQCNYCHMPHSPRGKGRKPCPPPHSPDAVHQGGSHG